MRWRKLNIDAACAMGACDSGGGPYQLSNDFLNSFRLSRQLHSFRLSRQLHQPSLSLSDCTVWLLHCVLLPLVSCLLCFL